MSNNEIFYVFLSYASEDKDIVSAIEKSLDALGTELAFTLEPLRDIHHFEHGHSLKGQIYENLLKSSILFVVYTEALKRSHSYTGIEIGMFEAMARGAETGPVKSRRIVSLYLDEPPPSEADILGIKLNRDALSSAGDDAENRVKQLDPSNALEEFLKTTAYKIIDTALAVATVDSPSGSASTNPSADLPTRNDTLARSVFEDKKRRIKDVIKERIAPKLLNDLFEALSRVVERSSVQQKLITLRWSASEIDETNVMSGSKLLVKEGHDEDLAELFGIPDRFTSISWHKFGIAIRKHFSSDADFICGAIANAVASALRPGPIDNEQFFLTPSKQMYRIIVTRHYSFYDGSRLMNMYFIPVLSRFARDEISGTLALLNSSVQFRNLFIKQFGTFSFGTLEEISFDPVALRAKLGEFLRSFMMLEDESHVYGLDDPSHFSKINRLINSGARVSETFEIWRTQKSVLLEKTKQLYSERDQDKFAQFRTEWLLAYEIFSQTVDDLNRTLGQASTRFLDRWFDEGGAAKGEPSTRSEGPNVAGAAAQVHPT